MAKNAIVLCVDLKQRSGPGLAFDLKEIQAIVAVERVPDEGALECSGGIDRVLQRFTRPR